MNRGARNRPENENSRINFFCSSQGGDVQKRMLIIGVILTAHMLCPIWDAGAPGFNPKPDEGDFILPMPSGGEMVFRPVFIGEGDAPFAARKFIMGDPNGGYKEHPTSVTIGGAFSGRAHGRGDRLYYMGKYEVTESQFYSLISRHERGAEESVEGAFPIRDLSWFEALAFIDQYNQWLFANAKDYLPKNGAAVGWVRLPTEVEWEFAARGGVQVTKDEFDRKHPYGANLAVNEWFSGPGSSHNKIRKAGLLTPNPLGLHDMLGNVSEVTASMYQIEYYQGGTGGFVARGGHFLTAEKKIRSALRTEEPFYIEKPRKGIQPNRKPTLGMRLVLSSVIFADRNSGKQLKAAWEAYRGGKGASLPAAVSIRPTRVQTRVKTRDSFVHMERLKSEMIKSAGLPDALWHELGLLEASLADIDFIRKQAEEDSAYAWGKIAAERGFFIYRNIKKLPTFTNLLRMAKKTKRTTMADKYKERIAEVNENISQALSTYSESFRQLAKVDESAIETGFDKYVEFLVEHEAAEQTRVLKVVRDHFDVFQKEQRARTEEWRSDFSRIN